MLHKVIRYIQNNRPWWVPGEDKRLFCGEQLVLSDNRIAECQLEINHGYGHESRTGFRWAA